MLVAWLVFPLLLGVLALGCGLLLEQVAGVRLPGALLLPAGLSLVVVAAGLATTTEATAGLATPAVVALAAAGLKSAHVAWTPEDSRINRACCGASAAAVLCAAAATEARLSEWLARFEFLNHGLPPELQAIRDHPDALRQWKALLAVRAPAFKLGESAAYAALGCLGRTRDCVAHRNARLATLGTFPTKLADCVRQKVVPTRAAPSADWTSVVLVHEVAQWAHRTAHEWITLSRELLPLSC